MTTRKSRKKIFKLPTIRLRLITWIFLFIAAVTLPTLIKKTFFPTQIEAGWWNEGWQYRQVVTIANGSDDDATDIPYRIEIDTSALITDGKLQADGDDVRIVGRDGQIVRYQIEQSTLNTATTNIWFEATVPSNESKDYFLYYGNSVASAKEFTSDVESVAGDGTTVEMLDGFGYTTSTSYGRISDIKKDGTNLGVNGSLRNTAGYPGSWWNDQPFTRSLLASGPLFVEVKMEDTSYGNYSSFGTVINMFDNGYVHNRVYLNYNTSGTENLYYYLSFDSGTRNSVWVNSSGTLIDQAPNSGTLYEDDLGESWFGQRWTGSGNYGGTIVIENGSDWIRGGTSAQESYYQTNYSYSEAYVNTDFREIRWGTFAGDGGLTEMQAKAGVYGAQTLTLASEETTPGPAAFWKFDEGVNNTCSGGTNDVCDSTTQGNDGAFSGTAPTWKTEEFCVSGKCVSFDGTSGETITFADDNSLDFGTESFTISTWAIHHDYTYPKSNLMVKKSATCYSSGAANAGFDIGHGYNSNGIDVCIRDTSNNSVRSDITFDSGFQPSELINTWTHYSFVFNRSTDQVIIYINGVEQSNKLNISTVTGSINNSSALTIGGMYGWKTDGKIDEFKMYKYARSADQIKQDYLSQDSPQGGAAVLGTQDQVFMSDGLIGYWKMNETSGTTITDYSGNGNSGTLTNAQETGTGEASGTTATIVDADNASLATADDTYNNITIEITGGGSCGITTGTKRIIADYTGSTKTLTVDSAFSAETDNCTFLIDHYDSGKFGGGIQFGGLENGSNTGDAVIATIPAMTKTSAFAWYKFDSKGGTGSNTVFRMQNDDIGIKIQNGSARFHIDSHATLSINPTISGVTDNNWHYIGLTYDGTTMKAYFDGEEVGSSTGSYSIDTGTINIGDRSDLYAEHFNGKIDETRIYNRALSSSEITELYNWAPGPVGYWPMDENTGTGTTYDHSGNSNHGTMNGSMTESDWISGKTGSALEFDGSDDYVSISGTNLNDSGALTMMAWVNTSSLASTQSPFGYGAVNDWMNIRINTNGTYLIWDDLDNENSNIYGTTTLQTNTWYHIAVVIQADNTKKLYLNGVQEASDNTNATNTTNISDDTINFGRRNYGASPNQFSGKIDDFKVYNYVRTAGQINQDMGGVGESILGSSTLPDPLVYWKLDESQGQAANNSIPESSNYDGTFSTAITWASGKINSALNFDDALNQYIQSDNTINLPSDQTYTAWIKPSNLSGLKGILTTHNHSIFSNIGLNMHGTTLSISIGYTDNTREYLDKKSTQIIPTDQWTHVGLVHDNDKNTVSLYINGELDTTWTLTKTVNFSEEKILLGQWSNAYLGNYKFDGLIDEVKIYNSALSLNQIKKDMNAGSILSFSTGVNEKDNIVDGAGNDPVAEWDFNENSGSSTNDISGNGNTGTITGASWKKGKIGSGLNIENGQYISTSYDWNNLTDATIETWVKFDSSAIGSGIYSGIFGGVSAQQNTLFLYNADTLYWRVGGTQLSKSFSPVANTWYHIVATKTGTTGEMFINGQSIGSGFIGSSFTSQNIAIGTIDTGTATYSHKGLFDHPKIYNYVRTPAQIAYDYNRGKPIAHWKFDECQGSTINDNSGNGNSGTLTIGATGTQASIGTCNTASTAWGNGSNGKFNSSLNFDGTDDYISFPSANYGIGNDITVATWVKFTSNSQKPILSNRSGGGGRLYYGISGGKGFVYYNGSSPAGVTTTQSINDGNWHHFVYVRSGTTTSFFVDGVLDSAQTQTGYSAFDDAIRIGHDVANSTQYFPGQIDDTRIYNYALSLKQVGNIMNEGAAVRYGD